MLMGFFATISRNWALALLITFAIWPGLMFLVGWIGESRIVPTGENQSKAFFPGDFAFGIMFVTLAIFYTRAAEIDIETVKMLEEPSWIRLCTIISILIFIYMRRRDRFAYPRRAFRSPTKICHDIVGFMIIPFMLIWMEYPAISLFFRNSKLRDLSFSIELIALMWMFYGFCVWKDSTDEEMAEKAKYMHIDYWQPLWKKTPPQ